MPPISQHEGELARVACDAFDAGTVDGLKLAAKVFRGIIAYHPVLPTETVVELLEEIAAQASVMLHQGRKAEVIQ